ncbi:MAG: type VI secretion system baseplate subunit TssG [Rhodoferax sp.]
MSALIPTAQAADTQSPQGRLERILAELAVDATQFDFYHVLRHIDAAVPGTVPLGRAARPGAEPLRLTQQPSLIFAPSALHQYLPGVAAHGLGRLSVHHFGLFGPNGALPQHLTEYVQERILHSKDETIARFCDIFQHRMILLFYRAWADCQAVTSLDQPERDLFGRYTASLVGLGQLSLIHRDTVPDHLKLHHAGHLARQTRNPEGLIRPLAALLRIPVALKEYCLQWLSLADRDRTRLSSVALVGGRSGRRVELGDSSSRLGQGAIAGARVPDVQHKFRLRLGAMSLAEFERFLPGGVRFFQVRDWVRNYLGVELAWDARLVLEREQVPEVRLGSYGQLGWTTWLGMKPGRRARDAEDVLLDMERLSRAPKAAWDQQPEVCNV